ALPLLRGEPARDVEVDPGVILRGSAAEQRERALASGVQRRKDEVPGRGPRRGERRPVREEAGEHLEREVDAALLEERARERGVATLRVRAGPRLELGPREPADALVDHVGLRAREHRPGQRVEDARLALPDEVLEGG